MAIYDKPVKVLMREWADAHLAEGEEFSKNVAVQWFEDNFPKVKPGTVEMHIEAMSTNNGRIRQHHKSVYAGSNHDLFFKLGQNRFRLYVPQADPLPVYDLSDDDPTSIAQLSGEDITEIAEQLDAETFNAATEFAYERDLQNYLIKNLESLETGLRLYIDEDGMSGVEFNTGGRRIDILAMDAAGGFVVIELKVSSAYDRVVGQIARYMAWVEANLDCARPVRGMIVAKTINEDLKLACSRLRDVELMEYEMTFNVRLVTQSDVNKRA